MGAPGFGNVANLRPPFQRGNTLPRTSAAVRRAIFKCRKLSPEMVDILVAIARDANEETHVRIKAAEIILNKAIPNREGSSAVKVDPGPNAMRIEIVDPLKPDEVITINPQPLPNGHDTDDGPIRLTFGGDDERIDRGSHRASLAKNEYLGDKDCITSIAVHIVDPHAPPHELSPEPQPAPNSRSIVAALRDAEDAPFLRK